ncbi:MAG: phosphomannomutase/phosphoglucomutase, partial [Symbiobacteriaceae bacterium]|nr:phosphomannomutase/phosphoglucomutase [Symbiobacteriaceae bacterium]
EVLRRILIACGFDLVIIGHSSTPCFYHACFTLNSDAGVMITASHNPAPDNGLKLMLGRDALFGAQIQEVYQEVAAYEAQGEPPLPAVTPGMVTMVEHTSAYIADLLGRITLGPRHLKVVIDCGNGSVGPFAELVLDSLKDKISYTALNFTPDGTFPVHEADPVKPKNLVDIQRLVLEQGADIGIGFDGDGDRIGVVNDKAEILWGDQLMILFWREIMAKHPNSLGLVEVKCSQVLYDEIARLGGRPDYCRTGHSLIKARMKEENALFAGEMSGHLFFADEYYGFDDALYAALRLLRILSFEERSLSEMMADLPKMSITPEVRFASPDNVKFELVAKLSAELAKKHPVITIDGVRVLFPEGWGLFRASNTQPAIVARCEASTAEKLKEYTQELNELYLRLQPGSEPIKWE